MQKVRGGERLLNYGREDTLTSEKRRHSGAFGRVADGLVGSEDKEKNHVLRNDDCSSQEEDGMQREKEKVKAAMQVGGGSIKRRITVHRESTFLSKMIESSRVAPGKEIGGPESEGRDIGCEASIMSQLSRRYRRGQRTYDLFGRGGQNWKGMGEGGRGQNLLTSITHPTIGKGRGLKVSQ